jgi:aqualysin 1
MQSARIFSFILSVVIAQPLMAQGRNGQHAGPLPKFRTVHRAIPDQYIVVLDPAALPPASGVIGAAAGALTRRYGGTATILYEHALQGFAVRVPASAAQALSNDPMVAWVEEDGEVSLNTTQTNAPWHLDRIDQRPLPLDSSYTYERNGAGVHVYVIDSGIRAGHSDFGGRVTGGFTAINDGNGTADCNGHGTHVAGIIGGATSGVAKSANLHPVRVFGCTGGSAWSVIISGVDWVTAHHASPAVANMSLGGGGDTSIDTAVQNSINSGVTYVVAAGNDSNTDACTTSPSRVGAALTVGATDSSDAVASFSGQGSCVDIFAPGVSVISDWWDSDTATATLSGTSMATPAVAGVAAVYVGTNPGATPATVANTIISQGTSAVLSGITAGSPNLLLFENFMTACTPLTCNGQCGTIPDGCGGTLSCGGCDLGWCQSNHLCGCPGTYRVCSPGCVPPRSECP